MFSEIAFSDMSNEKILSSGVLECEVTRVADVILGTKKFSTFDLEHQLCYGIFHTLVNQC